MASKTVADKPHAVVIPLPFQSHIKAMLKLAKVLFFRGFYITFVNTEFNHNRFLRARGHNSLDGLPDFQFETIPDSVPPSDPDAYQDIASVFDSVRKNFLQPFLELVAKLNTASSSRNVPPVTCIVADGFTSTFTVTAAQELALPLFLFFTISAASFMGIKQYSALKVKGITPLKDESQLENGYLDSIVEWIPGMKGVRLRDLPSFFQTTDPNDIIFNFCMESAEFAAKATAIGVHTFDALETDVLTALSSIFPRVYAIGPLQLHLDQIQEKSLDSVGYNLLKEQAECLSWLKSFGPKSVVYVNFGSTTLMTQEQLNEFGMGLANSKHPFLWIIRRDLVIGDSAILPPEFYKDTKERSLIAQWCSQEEVLNHPSIGGFLTHSGWGSTIESLSAGVPMLCWPFFADQQTNCRYSCNEWSVGMEIDKNVKRDEVEKLVRELMEGERGKEIRNKAMEWKYLAEEATRPNGSSSMNLNKLVKEVLLSKD
ncbi:7-deoxyloganetin glucosyltransferase [Ricinus communis]|uniref:Glycosyltransferase n=1 Tax=Ricinus communis TaxID=3988 RepID=B9SVU5_RICCO|nr:7-deoxyloganetin glucosyltransferase [Ricinus communis]EEF32258.1 UDP-glucuronosyltransferase, putative [Ricinus communis]|eukprot:XP_002530114.1 7-deoxyloganetin glucosyltransferase [Ricinus communis]